MPPERISERTSSRARLPTGHDHRHHPGDGTGYA
jgi:hypothetical protein